jgi:hypothetical protein
MSDNKSQTTMPTLPSEHRTRQLLARAMTILNVVAGEGIFWEGVEKPENSMFEVSNEMGFGNSDDPWEDMIRMLNQ